MDRSHRVVQTERKTLIKIGNEKRGGSQILRTPIPVTITTRSVLNFITKDTSYKRHLQT